MIGLTAAVYSCFHLSLCRSCWAYYMTVGIYIYLFGGKLLLTFFIQRLQAFFICVTFFTFLKRFFIFGERFFIYGVCRMSRMTTIPPVTVHGASPPMHAAVFPNCTSREPSGEPRRVAEPLVRQSSLVSSYRRAQRCAVRRIVTSWRHGRTTHTRPHMIHLRPDCTVDQHRQRLPRDHSRANSVAPTLTLVTGTDDPAINNQLSLSLFHSRLV